MKKIFLALIFVLLPCIGQAASVVKSTVPLTVEELLPKSSSYWNLIKGNWTNGNKISAEELERLNRLNWVTSEGGFIALTSLNCEGFFMVSKTVWESFSEEEQSLFYFQMQAGQPRKCKNGKRSPVKGRTYHPLPSQYRRTVETVVAEQGDNLPIEDLYFSYVFLAADDIARAHYKSAALYLQNLKSKIDEEEYYCEMTASDKELCWIEPPAIIGNIGNKQVYELLDTLDSLVQEKGIYYVPISASDYPNYKFKAKEYLARPVSLTVTVTEVIAEVDRNYIAAIMGELQTTGPCRSSYYNHGNYIPYSDVANDCSELTKAEDSRDSRRLIIEVPPGLSDILSGVRRGSVIVVKGEGKGLRFWNNYLGNVPFLKAHKIIRT